MRAFLEKFLFGSTVQQEMEVHDAFDRITVKLDGLHHRHADELATRDAEIARLRELIAGVGRLAAGAGEEEG